MSFATLTYGEPGDVADYLNELDANPAELRAALINALTRIHHLEKHSHKPIDQGAIFDRLQALELKLAAGTASEIPPVQSPKSSD